jgi:pyruvate/2-oxoacid:ferredoxin oxidoreductase beta subunit
MNAGHELNKLRKRQPRLCPGCGETVPMLSYQRACSNRCRLRIMREQKKVMRELGDLSPTPKN